ncbi:MAG: WD40 repeat domain-containing protein [Alphaproteobacteria bacterium]|nr:WD40 repeat domain-containing protein [Alphaproteobacteria bacterium]
MKFRNLFIAMSVLCLFIAAAGYSLLSANNAPFSVVLGSPSPHSNKSDLPQLAVDLSFSKNGRHLVAWQKNGKIVSWDLSSGKVKEIGRSNSVFAYCTGKDLILKGKDDGTLAVETLGGKVITLLEVGAMEHAAWSKDCSKFALAPKGKKLIELWDGEQIFQIGSAATSMPVRNGIALSADGSQIAAALGEHSSTMGHRTVVETYSPQPDGKLARRSVYSAANSVLGMWKMVFSPVSSHLFVGSQVAGKSGLRSFESNTGSEDWHQQGFRSYWVRALAISPDGAQLISGDEKGKLRIWDAATGKRLNSYETGLVVQSVAFSADGQRLAVALWDGTIKILKLQDTLAAGG